MRSVELILFLVGKCMMDGSGHKSCRCQKGYSGNLCDKKSYDTNTDNVPTDTNSGAEDLCLKKKCLNGGQCEVISGIAYCR